MDDPKPYDLSQPFDADELLGGFTVEERQVQMDPDSPAGRHLAAMQAWFRRREPRSLPGIAFSLLHPAADHRLRQVQILADLTVLFPDVRISSTVSALNSGVNVRLARGAMWTPVRAMLPHRAAERSHANGPCADGTGKVSS